MKEELEIPRGLNLKCSRFELSKEARELASKCLASFKREVIFCYFLKKDTTYIDCFTCKDYVACPLFKDMDKNINTYEFFLDLDVSKTSLKEKKAKIK